MKRTEKPCATYANPHKGKNCRCIKLCVYCGHTEKEHRENARAST